MNKYHCPGFLAFLFLLLSATGYARQDTSATCHDLYSKATRLALASNFRDAEDMYARAMVCYRQAAHIDSFFHAFLFALDCIRENAEFLRLQDSIDRFELLLEENADVLTPAVSFQINDAIQLFKIYQEINLGRTGTILESLHAYIRDLEACIARDQTDFCKHRKIHAEFLLAKTHIEAGAYEDAISSLTSVLSGVRAFEDIYTKDGAILTFYQALIRAKVLQGRSFEGIQFDIDNLLDVLEKNEDKHTERTISVYTFLFDLYLGAGYTDSAESCMEKLITLDTISQHEAEILGKAGDLAFERKAYTEAVQLYRNALKKITTDRGIKNEAYAGYQYKLGITKRALGQNAGALEAFNEALFSQSTTSQKPPPLQSPALQSLNRHLRTLNVLQQKAEVLFHMYSSSNDLKLLEAAWQSASLSAHLLEALRTGYTSDQDKRLIIADSYRTFETALGICHTLDMLHPDASWTDTAFYLMEQSRALNLLETLLHSKAIQYADIPDTLIDRERILRGEIEARSNVLRSGFTRDALHGADALSRELALTKLKKEYEGLLAYIGEAHPSYYQLRYQQPLRTLDAIDPCLSDHQALIEYFTGQTHIYALKRINGRTELYQIQIPSQFHHWVDDYRQSTRQYLLHKDTSVIRIWANAAYHLYRTIVDPLGTLSESLLVIPDGSLNYISFASLIREKPRDLSLPGQFPYLLGTHTISYAYSAALLIELDQKQKQTETSGILAIAPDFSGTPDLEALKYHLEETAILRRRYGATLLTGHQARKGNAIDHFQSNPGFSIAHISTHGIANPEKGEDSWLAFPKEDAGVEKLYARDLYNINTGLDLVFLSACDTGTGELQRGEGMISLARGFFYAGARSLVTTLWSIDEKRTQNIVLRFYQNLTEGMQMDAALARAQRGYLAELRASEMIYGHPAYWAAFIQVGKTKPLKIRKSSHQAPLRMILLGMCVFLLAIGTIIYLKSSGR